MSIPTWLDASFAPLVDAAVRGAIILLVVLVLTHLMRRRSAAARHALWAGAVCAQLLLAGWAVAGPRWSVAIPRAVDAVLPSLAAPQAMATSSLETVPTAPVSRRSEHVRQSVEKVAPAGAKPASAPSVRDANVTTNAAPPATIQPRTPISWRTVLLVVWALGVVVVLIRLAVGTMIVAALAKRGARVDDGHWLAQAQRIAGALGITRPLTLLRGDRIGVPITWGIVYPVVLLPADADAWPDERRQFVLVHEMAHVKRLDALTQLVGQFVLALFWFNPLVWIANRRMQLEREHACDDYVLRHGTSASHYAEELLAMVRSLGTSRSGVQPAFAALAMARRSEFEGRMLSILDPVMSRRPLSRARGTLGVLASLLVVVPLAALRPYHQPATVVPLAAADSASGTKAETGDEFPKSFKVQLLPDTGGDSNSAKGAEGAQRTVGALAAGLAALATRATTTDSALASTQRSLAHMATTNPKSCDDDVVRGTTIRSIHSDEDDDGSRSSIRYLNVNDDHCTETRLTGKVTFNDDETGIVAMAPDAVAVFRERVGNQRRELIVRPNGSGLSYIYTKNGVSAPFDAGAQAWFANMVQMVLREGAVNVEPRVARLRRQGGVDAVLRMIAEIQSSGSKRAHYLALLNEGGVTSEEADRLVRQAARDIASSGDLRAVLIAAAPLVRDQTRSASALEEAAAAVPSSGDRTAVLTEYGDTRNHAMLMSVMRMAATIPSSGDKSRLLSMLISRYLDGGDAELRDAFFRTLGTVPSSGDMRRVLTGAAQGYAGTSQPVALAIIAATNAVASSGDRAAVLLRVADSGALRDAKVREAYLDAAQRLAAGDANRVLTAAARR